MPNSNKKSQKKKQNKKTASKQNMNNKEPEVRINFEEISTLDIANFSEDDLKENDTALTYAKKNPEFAALIFTILTTTAYFIIKIIAFMFFAGQCFNNGVELKYIKVDSDPIIFITIALIVLALISGTIISKIEELVSKYYILADIIAFISLSSVIFITMGKSSNEIGLCLRLLASCISSALIIAFLILWKNVQYQLISRINNTIDKKVSQLNHTTRLIIIVASFSFILIIVSFFLGYSSTSDTKEFKTIDDKYIVLYMNDEIAVCSPYKEGKNSITINRKIQKNFSVSDIKFETKEFDEVNWENER